MTTKSIWLAYDGYNSHFRAVFHDPQNGGVYKHGLEEWELEGKAQQTLSEVWVAFEDYYPYDEDDDTEGAVLGVFASKQEAKTKFPNAGEIYVYNLDDNVQVVWRGQAPWGKTRWEVDIDRKSKEASAWENNKSFKETQHHYWTGSSTVFCWASSKEEAIKIGWEKVREYEFLKWARG